MEIDENRLRQVWAGIEGVLLGRHEGKRLDEMLLPPCDEVEISRLEKILETSLPSEYVASLKIHAGTTYWVGLWDGISLASTDIVVEDWKYSLSAVQDRKGRNLNLVATGPVRGQLFDRRWIPFASDNGVPICLDLNPAPGGNPGQIIYLDWEDGGVRVIADSLIAFMEDGLRKMER